MQSPLHVSCSKTYNNITNDFNIEYKNIISKWNPKVEFLSKNNTVTKSEFNLDDGAKQFYS